MSNILQDIFRDNYERIIYTLHPRKSVIENVDRMINCGDPSFGGAMYGCGKCGTLKFVPFRCHSRFCPTCGTKYSIDRTTSMSFKIINVQHRHCVFTIDSELRHFFLEDRELLGLLSEGGIGNSGLWRAKTHFNYTYLRNAFRTALLNLMEKKIGSSFKKVKAKCYKEHKDGFYVSAKPNKCNPTIVAKYIGRYLGRPVIATSRIDAYDGENVTFHYNRHEDNQRVVETIPVMDFIARLIQHILEKHFKQIRYYGLYARSRENDKKINLAIAKEKRKTILSFNRWRDCTLSSFGYDPLKCPYCGETMLFLELYHKHQHISLNEMYERAMGRLPSPSSA